MLAELVAVEAAAHTVHSAVECQACVRTRKLALTALANLSFNNPQVVTTTAPKLCFTLSDIVFNTVHCIHIAQVKVCLTSHPQLLSAMSGLLSGPAQPAQKAAAHLVRNLAWRADSRAQACLARAGLAGALLDCARRQAAPLTRATRAGPAVEPGPGPATQALKVILSGLWNLSAHASGSKATLCSAPGSLEFLAALVRSSALQLVECGGGVLRNVVQHAVRTADR